MLFMCEVWCVCHYVYFFFFKQKTAYEMRISDWSSDVCSSDLMIKLRNLVTLRQIGIEIILAVEARPRVDLGLDRHARAHSLPDALAVRHRQHPRHRGIDQRHLRVRLRPERRRGARKQLGVGRDLGVDLKADHDLPLDRKSTRLHSSH